MAKIKQEFLVQVSVKRKKTGAINNLKRYVELKLNWQNNRGTLANDEVISFMNEDKVPEEGGFFSYKFNVKNLEVVKDWKKDFFKDKVIRCQLEPIQDEESIKIITYWGVQVEPTQYRTSSFLIIGLVFVALVGGVLAWFLWRKRQR